MTRRLNLPAIAGSVAAVAVVTIAIELFKTFVPVLSLGVLYVIAVLVVAASVGNAVRAAGRDRERPRVQLVPPAAAAHVHARRPGRTGSRSPPMSSSRSAVSLLADRVRRRAAEAEQREREAALLADIASDLLGGRELRDELDVDLRAGRGGPRSQPGENRARPARAARGRGAAPAGGGQADGRHALPAGGRSAEHRRARPLSAGAGLARRGRRRPRATGARGDRRRRAPAERHRQDGRPAGGLARPPLAADGDPGSGGRPSLRRAPARRVRSRRARRDDRHRGQAARAARVEPARALAAAGRTRPRRARALVGRRARGPGARRDARLGAGRRRLRARGAARAGRRDADPARAREPARERAQVLPAGAPGTSASDLHAEGGDRARRRPGCRGSRRTSWSGSSSHSTAPARGDAGRGAGLGLAIARGFAEANGGRVWAESRPGPGSIVRAGAPRSWSSRRRSP